MKSPQLRKAGCKETLHCHLGRSDSGSNQTQKATSCKQRTHFRPNHPVKGSKPSHRRNHTTPTPLQSKAHLDGGCQGGWGGRARARPRPAAPRLCSALQRGDRRSRPQRKGRAPGLPLPENCVGDPPPGIEAGATECPQVGAGWGVFQKPAKAPSHQGLPSSSGPLAPRDTRYTTCQVRGGGVPERRPRRARGHSFPLLPRPGESGGQRAGKPQPRGGRPGRTDGGGALTGSGRGAGKD